MRRSVVSTRMRACAPLFHRDARADGEGTLDTDTGTRDTGRRVAEAGCAREVGVDGVHGIFPVAALFPCDWRRGWKRRKRRKRRRCKSRGGGASPPQVVEEEDAAGMVRIRSAIML